MAKSDEIRWYSKTASEVEKKLNTSIQSGLETGEAKKRIEKYGPNKLKEAPGRTLFEMLIDQFKEILVLILLVAAAVSGILGEVEDTVVILLIVVLNAILGVVQENRAEKSLSALKKLSAPIARVKRDGRVVELPASEIVPGDLILLEAGAHVPCDCRIVESANLKIEEAALTGESVPVDKVLDELDDEQIGIGDRLNMAFSGTNVTYGRGTAIAVKTGMNTEIGKIAEMIQTTPQEITPMQRKLNEVGKVLGGLALGLVVIVFFAGILRGEDAMEMFMTSVSLAVAAIPEGLPAVVTIVLALGVQRMIRRNAIIRKLPAVETLGTATVIASDKTGTLTQNEMTVVRIYSGDNEVEVTGQGYEPKGEFKALSNGKELGVIDDIGVKTTLIGGLLSNDAKLIKNDKEHVMIGDPTEGALVVAAVKAGLNEEDIVSDLPRIGEIPFDSDRKRMTTIHKIEDKDAIDNSIRGDKSLISFTKGAPDVLLACCNRIYEDGEVRTLDDLRREALIDKNASMASKALRILGVACRPLDKIPDNINPETLERDLIFLGFQGMIDPARPEAKRAVAVAKGAGIRTVMVTGDHKITAAAIAKDLGIADEESKIVSGHELEDMDDNRLEEMIDDVRVFARVSPEHKVRIVSALKKRGHIVAMTGDGVNDAPALKRADIGTAMGITGTDVSKEAADMVLSDDNFATIVSAVSEGRTIFANIKKAINYLLSCNVGEIAAIFAAIVLGLGRPLTAIQILWVNLVTDGLPALALGVDPPEKGIMNRRPRDPKEGVFSGGILQQIGLYGLFIGGITLAIYYLTLTIESWGVGNEAGTIVKARTMAFATLAFSQLFHSFNSRSSIKSLITIGPFSNRPLIFATLFSAFLQVIVLTIPQLETVFDTVALNLADWIKIILFAVTPVIFVEIVKLIRRLSGAEE